MARWNFPGTLVDDSPPQPRSSLVAKRNTRPASWVPPETSTVSPKTSVAQASFLAERSLRRSRSFQQAHSGVSTPGADIQDVISQFPFPPAAPAPANITLPLL